MNHSRVDIQPSPLRQLKSVSLLIFVSLLLLISVCAQNAYGAQATLAWDQSSDAAVTGYKLYWGTQSQQYQLLADVATSTTETVSDLQAGTTYYFAATAYDAQGNESRYSNEVTFTAPADCTYSITPSSASFPAAGGTGTLTVTTQSTCSWTAVSGASWITITSGYGETGSGTVTYSIGANTTSSSRMAGSTIAGESFTVTQAGAETYTITASAGTGGTISPYGSVTVAQGGSQSFSVSAGTGYTVQNVAVDGVSQGPITSYTFTSVTVDHTIQATFMPVSYTLSVTKTGTGEGTVSSNPTGSSFPSGTTVTLAAAPASGSTFTGWSGACTGTSSTCTVVMTSNQSVTASFAVTTSPANVIALTVRAYKIKGSKYADLTWSGAASDPYGNVRLYRNDSVLTTPNDGAFTDGPYGSGKPQTYRVCDQATCSESVTVSW